MRAGQVKVGLLIVVKQPKFPAIGVMAGFTFRPEAAKMRVVGRVAGYAIKLDLGEIIGDMAGLASDQQVQTNQRKLRQIMVKSHIIAPAFRAVAGFTFVPERAVMRVIGQVATHATGRGLVFKNIDRVAAITARLLVLSGEGKISILVVVKPDPAPFSANMAAFAAGAKTVLVGILNPVAAHTSARQIFINLARMAGGAGHGCMAILQGKPCLRMVKIADLHPVG